MAIYGGFHGGQGVGRGRLQPRRRPTSSPVAQPPQANDAAAKRGALLRNVSQQMTQDQRSAAFTNAQKSGMSAVDFAKMMRAGLNTPGQQPNVGGFRPQPQPQVTDTMRRQMETMRQAGATTQDLAAYANRIRSQSGGGVRQQPLGGNIGGGQPGGQQPPGYGEWASKQFHPTMQMTPEQSQRYNDNLMRRYQSEFGGGQSQMSSSYPYQDANGQWMQGGQPIAGYQQGGGGQPGGGAQRQGGTAADGYGQNIGSQQVVDPGKMLRDKFNLPADYMNNYSGGGGDPYQEYQQNYGRGTRAETEPMMSREQFQQTMDQRRQQFEQSGGAAGQSVPNGPYGGRMPVNGGFSGGGGQPGDGTYFPGGTAANNYGMGGQPGGGAYLTGGTSDNNYGRGWGGGQPAPVTQPTGNVGGYQPYQNPTPWGDGSANEWWKTNHPTSKRTPEQEAFYDQFGFGGADRNLGGVEKGILKSGMIGRQAWDAFGIKQTPGVSGQPNPADYYNPLVGGAQNRVGNTIGGGGLYGGPGGNEALNYGMDLLRNANSGAPESAPGVERAPTYGNNYSDPTFGSFNLPRTDPSQIAGPNSRNIYDPSQTNFGGPQASADRFGGPNVNMDAAGPGRVGPGYNDLVNQAQRFGGNAPMIGRENINAPNAASDPLARRNFESATTGNEALASGAGGIDITKMDAAQSAYDKSLLDAANWSGLIDAGSRGFGAPGKNDVRTTAQLHATAPVIAQLAKEHGERSLEAERTNLGARGEALGRLTQTGSAAGDESRGVGQLNLGGAELGGRLGVEQRGQDIQQGQFGSNQSIEALRALTGAATGLQGAETGRYEAQTGRINTTGNLDLGAFRAGTERGDAIGQQILQEFTAGTGRGKVIGDMMLQADQLRQTGDIQGYNALTDRIATQAGISNQEAQNLISGFRAQTERGLGVGGLRNEAGRTDLGYAELNSQNIDRFNARQLERHGNNVQAYQAETQRLNTLFGGAGQFADINQRGAIEAGHQNIEAANLAMRVLDGAADAQQETNSLYQRALSGDQAAQQEYTQFMQSLGWAQQQFNVNRNDANPMHNFGGFVGGVVSSGVPAYLGRGR